MNSSKMKQYRMMAEVISAAGQEFRLAIMDFLKDGERCVCDIADHIAADRSNVSRHLTVMVNAGLLTRRKKGVNVLYSLRTPCILNIINCVTAVIKERRKSLK